MPAEHFRDGIFVAEGEKVVQRLLKSDCIVLSLLLTEDWFSRVRPIVEVRKERINVFVAEKDLLDTIVGFHLHQGIMAIGKIPVQPTLEHIIQKSKQPYFFVAIDGLTNSENLGVLVRNCVALGVQALLVGETSSSPYLRRAVRNSMGTVFKIPVLHCENLSETIKTLKNLYSIHTYAAHPHTEEQCIKDADFRRSCCIVFGSEGKGLSEPILSASTSAVTIPMQSGVDSLNVASASAVFLYEVVRQRETSKRK